LARSFHANMQRGGKSMGAGFVLKVCMYSRLTRRINELSLNTTRTRYDNTKRCPKGKSGTTARSHRLGSPVWGSPAVSAWEKPGEGFWAPHARRRALRAAPSHQMEPPRSGLQGLSTEYTKWGYGASKIVRIKRIIVMDVCIQGQGTFLTARVKRSQRFTIPKWGYGASKIVRIKRIV